MIKVDSSIEVLAGFSNDLQFVLKKEKICKFMIFKNRNIDPIDEPMETIENEPIDDNRIFYIRLEFDRQHKGLDRLSFSNENKIGSVTFKKLSIKRLERGEFNLKSDLKLG